MKHLRFIAILLSLAVFLSACGAQPATETPVVVEETQPSATREVKPVSLNVFAAASLTESFTELATVFEADHPGVKVNLNFGASQDLSNQILNDAPADVYASASPKPMTALVDKGAVTEDAVKVFATNSLVVVMPENNPAGLKTLQDLAKPGVRVVMAAVEVPAGGYTLNFLENASKDSGFGSNFKDNVLKNVVSYEKDVKAVRSKVELGEADAGIVYGTDMAGTKLQKIDIPAALNVIAKYPIAVVSKTTQLETAKLWVDAVLSADGQKILAKYGFTAIP